MKKSKPMNKKTLPKMNQSHVKNDTVIARDYVNRKHTVNKPRGEHNRAYNEAILDIVKGR